MAQGQDSTPAQRNLLIISELLPGVYDNVNQHYFERRRELDEAERHPRIKTTITRVTAPAFGEHVFLWINQGGSGENIQRSYRLATLSADGLAEEVTMRHYLGTHAEITTNDLARLTPGDLRRTDGCDYHFRRRADHFHGAQRPRACLFEWEGDQVYTENFIQLSASSLWFIDDKFIVDSDARITGVPSGEPFWLERAREFHCYVDIPGVGGGRDIPFERHDDIVLHDRGDTHWFTSREVEPRELGLTLQSVTWHVLNERDGAFNRNSLVLYSHERLSDGTVQNHGYAFTEPGAERIGMNQGWMLTNCASVPRELARPEM